jgi:hypothetical protein
MRRAVVIVLRALVVAWRRLAGGTMGSETDEDDATASSLTEDSDPASYRFTVHEYDGGRGSTLLMFFGSYAGARAFALEKSQATRDRAFRIFDEGDLVAVAMNGAVTGPSGKGPDRNPDTPPPSGRAEWHPWLEKNPEERPQSWANWNANDREKPPRSAEEFELYSDSEIRGIDRDAGPYRFMNMLAGASPSGLAQPVATVRIQHVTSANPKDDDAEHGGRHVDEIAALVSLTLGVRVRAGDRTRYLDRQDEDPAGQPRSQSEVLRPVLLPGSRTPIIGHAKRVADLDELDLLDLYPQLSPPAACALVRAARLYQAALWDSERDAALSWILLSSAIEAAAGVALKGSEKKWSAVEMMRELDPRLYEACKAGGESVVKSVADTQKGLLGATKKFVTFVQDFMPDAPAARPDECVQDWSPAGLEQPMREIYALRSRHLHAGIPFPWELRGVPLSGGNGVPREWYAWLPHDEIPVHLTRDPKSVPNTKRPVHLHVFAHIVRGSLLKWWATRP